MSPRLKLALAAAVIVGLLAAAYLYSPHERGAPVLKRELSAAGAELVSAVEHLGGGRVDEAKEYLLRSRSRLLEASKIFRETEAQLSPAERDVYAAVLSFYGRALSLGLGTVEALSVKNSFVDIKGEFTESAVLEALPALEVDAEALGELASGYESLAAELKTAIQEAPKVGEFPGLSGADVAAYEALASALSRVKAELDSRFAEYVEMVPIYVPLSHELIIKDPLLEMLGTPEDIVPPELASFFSEFDADGDGWLSLGEALAFYRWVDENIAYRYDDEGVEAPFPGALVGDGRPGGDYWQKPYETWKERAGDDEDVAILEAAFYRYFSVPAYVATVRTPEWGEYAVALVRIGSWGDFYRSLGRMPYYKYEAWYCMIVDNAHSDVFGFLGFGLKPEECKIIEVYTLEEAVAARA